MKNSSFNKLLIGAVVVFVVYIITVIFDGSSASKKNFDLSIKWDQIKKIELAKGDSKLELISQTDGTWVLPSKNNYEVSDSSIRAFLLKLMDISTSQVVQVSSSGLEKLGLNESGKSSGLGTITLFYQDKEAGKIYLGALRTRKGESMETQVSLSGEYVKYSNSDNVYMLPMAISLQLDPKSWITTELINVFAKDVVSYKNPKFKLEKSGDLLDESNNSFSNNLVIPGGKQVQESQVSQVVSALENFSLVDVYSLDNKEIEGREQQGIVSYILRNGQEYEFILSKKDKKFLVQVQTKINSDIQARVKELLDSKQKESASGKEGEKDTKQPNIELANTDQVEKQNALFKPWVYEIPEYLYGRLLKKEAELLVDIKAPISNVKK